VGLFRSYHGQVGFCKPLDKCDNGNGQIGFFFILFNGKKLEDFKPTRGIRQDDPISPYLFLLPAEGLSCLLKVNDQSSQLGGIKVAPTAPLVNHLLFADDSLLFFKGSREGAEELSVLLNKYCQASGQRINKDKSSIFFTKGCPKSRRDIIKGVLEVQTGALNERYLGMPTDVGSSRGGNFKFLRDRVWAKVKGWPEKFSQLAVRRFSLNLWLIPFMSIQWHASDYLVVFVTISTR
jgi:hypothetical protein